MSSIDYSQLRSLTAQEIEQALLREGFILRRRHGATRIYRHPDGRRVTLHFHRGGQTFAIGTLKSIVEKQARWSEADLKRLGILR
jgi:predicted RNA binding protein YcfA (HicA-like mRNA interferase family)